MTTQAFKIWKLLDASILRLSETLIVVMGVVLVAFLCLGIIGRYIADFSLQFLEAGTRFLFIWFCLLGVGLALREKGHVGFELLRQKLPPHLGGIVEILAHCCVLLFTLLLLWGSREALIISASQTEPTTGLSSLWTMLSVPVGVVLMIYHQLCLIVETYRGSPLR